MLFSLPALLPLSNDTIGQTVFEKCTEVVQRRIQDPLNGLPGIEGHVGRVDHVFSMEENVVLERRLKPLPVFLSFRTLKEPFLLQDEFFLFEHVQSCAAQNPFVEGLDESPGIDQPSPGRINQNGPPFNQLDGLFIR